MGFLVSVLVAAAVAVVAGLSVLVFTKKIGPGVGIASGLSAALTLAFMLGSVVTIDADKVGIKKRVLFADPISEGRVIARENEKGFQADIIRAGFHFQPLLHYVYDVDEVEIVEIPKGYYGLIEAKDGLPLNPGEIMAQEWSDAEFSNMLDANYFLEHDGRKGLQTTILKPGRYPLNLYAFNVTYGDEHMRAVYDADGLTVTRFNVANEDGAIVKPDNVMDTTMVDIPKGFVGVVTSRVNNKPDNECAVENNFAEEANLEIAAPVVATGCRGVWVDALMPGGYYLNRAAYDVVLQNTQLTALEYSGGYNSKTIDLSVDQKGNITQNPSNVEIPVPPNAADKAIDVKVEGWTVFQNLKILAQVTPETAPYLVASVGDFSKAENKVITPAVWSEVRDVLGGIAPLPTEVPVFDEEGNPVFENGARKYNIEIKPRRVRILDIIENREHLQEEVSKRLLAQGSKAGVNIMEVRFGNPDIPPELLTARKREQLATQLQASYRQEAVAQEQRVITEQQAATANQQAVLVKQQIANETSELKKTERENLGEAERLYLEQVARGENARAMVLGKDRVLMLNLADRVLDTLATNPELVAMVGKLVPNTVVNGGGGLDSAAAIFSGVLGKKDNE